jgi:hypothetical protein
MAGCKRRARCFKLSAAVAGQAAPEAPTAAPPRPAFAAPGATAPELHVLHGAGLRYVCPWRSNAGSGGDLRDREKSGGDYNDACQRNLLQHDGGFSL